MFDVIDFEWEEKGLVIERKPVYYNETLVDETINVSLNYSLSDYKNKELMYKKILEDVEILRNRFVEIQKSRKG